MELHVLSDNEGKKVNIVKSPDASALLVDVDVDPVPHMVAVDSLELLNLSEEDLRKIQERDPKFIKSLISPHEGAPGHYDLSRMARAILKSEFDIMWCPPVSHFQEVGPHSSGDIPVHVTSVSFRGGMDEL